MSLFSGRIASIAGTGSYIPEKVLTNHDLSEMVETDDQWIVERTGIRERHIAAEGELTSDLAVKAAERALEDAGLGSEDIDMIIVATNTPDTLFPGVGPIVQGKLGAKKAGAFDLQAGCTSCIYAMAVGASGIASGLWQNVLVIGAEVLSRIINWEDRNTCVLFGDGAGAVVLTSANEDGPAILSARLCADGEKSGHITLPAGLISQPATYETVDQKLHYVHMKGNEVFRFVNRVLPPFLKELCKTSRLAVDDIDWWIFHQANLRIMESVMKRLGISSEKAIVDLDKYGNTSAASTLIALDEALKENRISKGDKVLLTSFGAGMTYGAIIYQA
jgi:3-oxoacyl-[acyl-carrier-protein] synthase-3